MSYFLLAIATILVIYILIVLIMIENKNIEIRKNKKDLQKVLDEQISLVLPLSKVFTVYFPKEKMVIQNAITLSSEYKSSEDFETKLMNVEQINYIFNHLFPLFRKYNLVESNKKYLLNKEKFTLNEEKINFLKNEQVDFIEDYNRFISFFPNNIISAILNIKSKTF